MDSARKEWDRRPGETDLAYNRFRIYIQADRPRRRDVICEKLGVTAATLNACIARGDWVARAAAYDDAMADAADRAALSHAETMQAKHLGLLQAMLERGLELIKEGDGDARAGAKMVTEGVRLERLIVGDATDRTERQVSTIDLDPDLRRLDDDERAEWLAGLEDEHVLRWLELDDKARARRR